MSVEERSMADPAKRPGCVTAYALLLAISGLFGLLGLTCIIALATDPRVADLYRQAGMSGLWFAVALPSTILSIATALGLWWMREWGLWLLYTIFGLSFLSSIVAIISNTQAQGLFQVIAYLIGTGVQILILFWFISNRHLFNGRPRAAPTELVEEEGDDAGV